MTDAKQLGRFSGAATWIYCLGFFTTMAMVKHG